MPASWHRTADVANLALLILFPIAWFSPILRAGFMPLLFGLDEISIMSGLYALLQTDVLLALVVAAFGVVIPYLKVICVLLSNRGKLPKIFKQLLFFLAKLAMAEIFLIALYIVVIKSIGVGRVEIGWGFYLFTACVLLSLFASLTGTLDRPAVMRVKQRKTN